jgi:hypothetical protein
MRTTDDKTRKIKPEISDEINISEFEVVRMKSGTNDIFKIIKNNNFIENTDYLIRHMADQLSSGTKYKNIYYFHPDAFGIMLIRSRNKKDYAKYYTLCQRCIKFHSDYQINLKQSEVSRLIDKLDKQTEELKISNNELKISNNELKKSNKKLIKIEK